MTSAPSDLHLAGTMPVGSRGRLLRVLADPLRMQILTLLAVEQLCTCHLVELTGARQTNVSNHLRALREAGLVTSEPFGRFTYHRLETDAIEGLAASLSAVDRQGVLTAAPQRRVRDGVGPPPSRASSS